MGTRFDHGGEVDKGKVHMRRDAGLCALAVLVVLCRFSRQNDSGDVRTLGDSIDDVAVARPKEMGQLEVRIKTIGKRTARENAQRRDRLVKLGQELVHKSELKSNLRFMAAEK